MFIPSGRFIKLRFGAIFSTICLCIYPILSIAQDAPNPTAPDLDLTIQYFNRELTPDGVLRESGYSEKMLRRRGHVWSYRVLPAIASANDTAHQNHEHKEFNHIVLPRHVTFDGKKVSVEYINAHDRQVIAIAPTEYENVNFDGSWPNTFYLIDPQFVAAMPVSQRISAVANARWHEVVKNGLYQRVLWNNNLMIPLIIETGDMSGSFSQRVKIFSNARLMKSLPWHHLNGYVQKEYSDFLD